MISHVVTPLKNHAKRLEICKYYLSSGGIIRAAIDYSYLKLGYC